VVVTERVRRQVFVAPESALAFTVGNAAATPQRLLPGDESPHPRTTQVPQGFLGSNLRYCPINPRIRAIETVTTASVLTSATPAIPPATPGCPRSAGAGLGRVS
jgi:hypothetical protein